MSSRLASVNGAIEMLKSQGLKVSKTRKYITSDLIHCGEIGFVYSAEVL